MVRVAICDDDKDMLKSMDYVVRETFQLHQFPYSLDVFCSGDDLLAHHQKNMYDIIFLDILMPERSGFDIAKDIRRLSDKTLLLFVTSQDDLVYDSFYYHPFYFLRKGNQKTFSDSLADAVDKIIAYIERNELITLDLGVGEFRAVCMQDILFIKSKTHFAEYHLVSGEVIQIREHLNAAEEKLRTKGFVRIHRQLIVNIYKTSKINISHYPEVLLSNGQSLPIGRKYKTQVQQKYSERMRNIL